ncbi:MAG: alpha-L-fucosidase [Balneolaceae bacterium]|nr:MAG: alpha-L-fucosidase [Balneolaceae bacterium]
MKKSINSLWVNNSLKSKMIRALLCVILTALFLFPKKNMLMAQTWSPNWDSITKHETPEWFRDAKFGIFIHWGVYSVPAWAPRGMYAEWYPTYMYQKDHPVSKYHRNTWGKDFEYRDFIPLWKAENWDPDEWADLFEKAGARYVIPVGEHHDGFPLWDSALTGWNAAQMGPKRDLIRELGEAVRARGMKYGPSYHGLLNYYTSEFSGPHPDYISDDYIEFMHAKIREIIDLFEPDILWLDGDWLQPLEVFRTRELIAYYYNQAEEWGKEVAVNDRWGQVRGIFGDFFTQEYEYDVIDRLIDHKWENTRGMGQSFGYNQNERLEDYLTVGELVELLVDNVSKNANLLLNVGPRADGTIPEVQKKLLLGLGDWLRVNGEAIYGTRPWFTAEATTTEGVRIRFTRKEGKLYVHLLDKPNVSQITIPRIFPDDGAEVSLLATGELLYWNLIDNNLTIKLPERLPGDHVYVLSISDEPGYLMKRSQ